MPEIRVRRPLSGDRNQCPQCSEFFNSVGAFSKHRVGDYTRDPHGHSLRRCLSPDEMRAREMAINRQGFWVTKRIDFDDLAEKMASIEGANSDPA